MSDPERPLHSVISTLPEAMRLMVLELEELELPEEVRADCAHCPISPPPGEPQTRDRPFHPVSRCCTYFPRMPNFLLGSALRRGGPGADKVRARIARGDLVDAMGITRSKEWFRDYARRSPTHFGREQEWRCPYWVEGPLACSIWADRCATCRTWFCRYLDGDRGYELWVALKRVIRHLEYTLARFCLEVGTPPPPGCPADEMERWYRWCADRVDLALPVELAELSHGDEELSAMVEALHRAMDAHGAPVPEVVAPRVKQVDREQGRVRLTGYSGLDPRWFDSTIFVLLARLDGQTPWRQALSDANAELEVPFGEDVVEDLWRAGLIAPPDEDDSVRGVVFRFRDLDTGEVLAESHDPADLPFGAPLLE